MPYLSKDTAYNVHRLLEHPLPKFALLVFRGLLLWLLLGHLSANCMSLWDGLLLLLILHFDASPNSPRVIVDYVRVIRKLPRGLEGEIEGSKYTAFQLEQNRVRFVWTRGVMVVWTLRALLYGIVVLALIALDAQEASLLPLMLLWLLLNNLKDGVAASLIVSFLKRE